MREAVGEKEMGRTVRMRKDVEKNDNERIEE